MGKKNASRLLAENMPAVKAMVLPVYGLRHGGDEPVLFAYTCDMPRIKRFDNALHIYDMRGTLYCFDFQEEALREICGPGKNTGP